MNLGFLTKDAKIQSRKLLTVVILVSGSLAWSFFVLYAFENIFVQFEGDPVFVYIGYALFLGFGAVSAIAGSALSGRVDRRRFLLLWTTLGVLASASVLVFSGVAFLFSSVLLGFSLGLGYPCFTSFLADCTVIEERARVSGVVIFLTFVLVVLAIGVVTVLGSGLLEVVVVSVLLRSMNYLALSRDSCKRAEGREKSWRVVLSSRDFVFYLFPWLMFNVATGLTAFIFPNLPSDVNAAFPIGNFLHYLGAAVAAIVAGLSADRFGRKQPVIVGMVMLGGSFAFLGLAPSYVSLLSYLSVSGVAWGFLIVIYLTVPGDLSVPGAREKFYALGIVVPLIIYAGLVATSKFVTVGVPTSSVASVLSLILFMSVIPVLRAMETLPESKLRERKLSEHVKKVGELVEGMR